MPFVAEVFPGAMTRSSNQIPAEEALGDSADKCSLLFSGTALPIMVSFLECRNMAAVGTGVIAVENNKWAVE